MQVVLDLRVGGGFIDGGGLGKLGELRWFQKSKWRISRRMWWFQW